MICSSVTTLSSRFGDGAGAGSGGLTEAARARVAEAQELAVLQVLLPLLKQVCRPALRASHRRPLALLCCSAICAEICSTCGVFPHTLSHTRSLQTVYSPPLFRWRIRAMPWGQLKGPPPTG